MSNSNIKIHHSNIFCLQWMQGWTLILASPLCWRMVSVCLPYHKGSHPTIWILRTKILQFASFEVSTLLWFCGIWHCNTGWVVLEIMKDLAGGGGGGGVHVTSTQSKICNSIKNADAGHKLCIHNKYYRSLNHSDSFYKSLLIVGLFSTKENQTFCNSMCSKMFTSVIY